MLLQGKEVIFGRLVKSCFNHIVLFLIAILAFASCALLKPKCPIENCNIAKIHQHHLIFDKKIMKESEKKRKENVRKFNEGNSESIDEELAEGVGETSDSSSVKDDESSDELESTHASSKKRNKNKEKEVVEDNEEVESDLSETSEAAKPKKKKSKKKKSKKDSEEEIDPDLQEAMASGNDTSAVDFDKSQNKLTEKEIKGVEKAIEKELAESEKEAKEIENKLKSKWRSRITAWFKKNQYPKIGEHWKGPVKKGNVPDYRVWPKVRVWPFTKEKDYTSY